MQKVRDKTKCKHPERTCKWCFECETEEEKTVKTITKQELEAATLALQAPLLRASERIILAALILKRNGGIELDYQAGEVLKKAYAVEEVRVNLEASYEGC